MTLRDIVIEKGMKDDIGVAVPLPGAAWDKTGVPVVIDFDEKHSIGIADISVHEGVMSCDIDFTVRVPFNDLLNFTPAIGGTFRRDTETKEVNNRSFVVTTVSLCSYTNKDKSIDNIGTQLKNRKHAR